MLSGCNVTFDYAIFRAKRLLASITEQLTILKTQTFLWELFDLLMKTLCTTLSAAELSELELEVIDKEDTILDLRAQSQSAHYRVIRVGPETKKHRTNHRQPTEPGLWTVN